MTSQWGRRDYEIAPCNRNCILCSSFYFCDGANIPGHDVSIEEQHGRLRDRRHELGASMDVGCFWGHRGHEHRRFERYYAEENARRGVRDDRFHWEQLGHLYSGNTDRWTIDKGCLEEPGLRLAWKPGTVYPLMCGTWSGRVVRHPRSEIVALCRANGQDLGAAMVRAGMAYAFTRYSGDYVAQEKAAIVSRTGLQAHDCEKPWDWRARGRAPGSPPSKR